MKKKKYIYKKHTHHAKKIYEHPVLVMLLFIAGFILAGGILLCLFAKPLIFTSYEAAPSSPTPNVVE